jgi:hypothetical protein
MADIEAYKTLENSLWLQPCEMFTLVNPMLSDS